MFVIQRHIFIHRGFSMLVSSNRFIFADYTVLSTYLNLSLELLIYLQIIPDRGLPVIRHIM